MKTSVSERCVSEGVWDLVGNTPMVRLSRIGAGVELCAKLESANPSGSVKDRPAKAMILEAEREGTIGPGATIVEATSGNTGISLAMLSAVRGYRCVLVMPEDMASTRRTILRGYGAEMVMTPAVRGMRGAVEEAERILSQTPGAYMPRQFENLENPRAHELTTGEEIFRQCDGHLDAIVAGVGTGGTLTGIARALLPRLPHLRVVAVEPKNSAVLSGGNPGLHALFGLGAGFVPPVLQRDLLSDIVTVTDLDAERMTTRLAKEEGLLVGPSSGANVYAALQVARNLGSGKRVVTILCDSGERYL